MDLTRIQQVVQDAKDRARASKGKKAEKQTASGHVAAWELAYADAYPGEFHPPVTGNELNALNGALRGYRADDRKAFIEFVVSNWKEIMNGQFRWMRHALPYPKILLFAKHHRGFWEAYEQHKDPNREITRRVASYEKKIMFPPPQITTRK